MAQPVDTTRLQSVKELRECGMASWDLTQVACREEIRNTHGMRILEF